MEMKWHPIIDGDLNGIPTNRWVLFTCGEDDGVETFVCMGMAELYIKDEGLVSLGERKDLYPSTGVIAWMELPEPYMPGRCDTCKHWKEWIDEYGDGCAKCELIVDPPFLFSTEQYFKCPLDD